MGCHDPLPLGVGLVVSLHAFHTITRVRLGRVWVLSVSKPPRLMSSLYKLLRLSMINFISVGGRKGDIFLDVMGSILC